MTRHRTIAELTVRKNSLSVNDLSLSAVRKEMKLALFPVAPSPVEQLAQARDLHSRPRRLDEDGCVGVDLTRADSIFQNIIFKK